MISKPGLSPTDIDTVKRFYPGTSEVNIELKPYQSILININPREQLYFIIRPEETRKYTIETIGHVDTVIVLFEDV